MERQITDTLLMVRPANFGFNEQTAESNAFQNRDTANEDAREKAKEEFDGFVSKLRAAGVEVMVVGDTDAPIKPDAVFPNNWISTHEDGSIILYPMMTANRRVERRQDVVKLLQTQFAASKFTDYSGEESHNSILEGTGSMVLDRPNRLCYACLSPRTDNALLDKWCKDNGYKKVAFTAVDGEGQEVYHTNVIMAMGEGFVVICMDTVKNLRERALLLDYFEETGKEIIEISIDQMNHFAGNMLQVRGKGGRTFLVMSEQAFNSLDEEQIEKIETHTNILHVPIYTIETLGGGSARCMMAEVYLPSKA